MQQGYEELPVTFCVFAFASDGWVMAADRAELRYSGQAVNIRTQDIALKIIHDETAGVAACFAGDAPVRSIAEDLVKAIRRGTLDLGKYLTPDERQDVISKFANQTLKKEKPISGNITGWRRTVVLVLPSGEVWRIEGINTVRATLQDHHYGAMYIGDDPNPAIYLLKRYYPTFPLELRSVDELTFLVAHSVVEAHFFNSYAVDGLDLLTYKNAGKEFHLFKQEELNTLTDRSTAISAMFSKHFFPET